jgi:hypothetical protein
VRFRKRQLTRCLSRNWFEPEPAAATSVCIHSPLGTLSGGVASLVCLLLGSALRERAPASSAGNGSSKRNLQLLPIRFPGRHARSKSLTATRACSRTGRSSGREHIPCADLPFIGQALRPSRPFFGRRKRGQEQRRENGDGIASNVRFRPGALCRDQVDLG